MKGRDNDRENKGMLDRDEIGIPELSLLLSSVSHKGLAYAT